MRSPENPTPSPNPDQLPVDDGLEAFRAGAEEHKEKVEAYLSEARNRAESRPDLSLLDVVAHEQDEVRTDYAKRLAHKGASTIISGSKRKLQRAGEVYAVITDAKIMLETEDITGKSKKNEKALQLLLGIKGHREKNDGELQKDSEGEADKLAAEVAKQRLIRAGAIDEKGEKRNLKWHNKLALKWNQWSQEGIKGWAKKAGATAAAGIAAGAVALGVGAGLAAGGAAVAGVAGATRVSKVFAAAKLGNRGRELTKAESDSAELVRGVREDYGREGTVPTASAANPNQQPADDGEQQRTGRLSRARKMLSDKLNARREKRQGGREQKLAEKRAVRQGRAAEHASALLLTEHFGDWAHDQRNRNRGRAAVGGAAALIAGAAGAQVVETISNADLFNGKVGAEPSNGDRTPLMPSPAEPTPSALPEATPSPTPEDDMLGGVYEGSVDPDGSTETPDDTDAGEQQPDATAEVDTSQAIELEVKDGQYVSQVFADAEGSFNENWSDMVNAAAAAEEAGELRVVYPEKGNKDLFWYEVKDSDGNWTSETEPVVRTMTEYTDGKYALAGEAGEAADTTTTTEETDPNPDNNVSAELKAGSDTVELSYDPDTDPDGEVTLRDLFVDAEGDAGENLVQMQEVLDAAKEAGLMRETGSGNYQIRLDDGWKNINAVPVEEILRLMSKNEYDLAA